MNALQLLPVLVVAWPAACIAGMCGGIVGALSASAASPARTVIPIAVAQPARPLTRVLAYNAGRISSYMVAGALPAAWPAGRKA
jgi:sulfite exporter TauE/SafE